MRFLFCILSLPFPFLTATFVCVRCSVLRHVGRQPSGQRRRAVLSPDRGPRVVAHHIGGPRGAGGGRARRDGSNHAARQRNVHIAAWVGLCVLLFLYLIHCSVHCALHILLLNNHLLTPVLLADLEVLLQQPRKHVHGSWCAVVQTVWKKRGRGVAGK